MDNSFTILFDYDSMIYKAVYKIVVSDDYKSTDYPNSGLIRKWFKDGRSREWMETEIINLTINRLEQMGNGIFQAIEDTRIEFFGVEYFLTSCPNSARKQASPIYKANRKPNKWVSLVRKELLKMGFASVHNEWEADDLIKDRAIELGVDKCIICSVDKDLKQIPGIHFDYYRPRLKNPDGSPQLDENGFRKVDPCRGLEVVTEQEAERFFWKQVLMGDSGDNIKGCPRIGEKTAEKLLDNCKSSEEYRDTVLQAYITRYEMTEGIKQFNLHKLLIGLGVKHRP